MAERIIKSLTDEVLAFNIILYQIFILTLLVLSKNVQATRSIPMFNTKSSKISHGAWRIPPTRLPQKILATPCVKF